MRSSRFIFKVEEALDGCRLTRAIALELEGVSGRKAKDLVDRGRVFIDEHRILNGSTRVRCGSTIEVHLDQDSSSPLLGTSSLLWESSDVIVVNKPPGIPVYGSHGVTAHTLLPLVKAMLVKAGKWRATDELVLVHRLDKDTTGALILARNQHAACLLEQEFRNRTVKKCYLVLAQGTFSAAHFERREPIQKSMGVHGTQVVHKSALTMFRVLERFKGCALLEAIPETGRTHQIRRHLASMGTPVLGDISYGPRRIRCPLFRAIPRHMLHAWRIGFKDPASGSKVEVEAPLPDDMREVLGMLRARK